MNKIIKTVTTLTIAFSMFGTAVMAESYQADQKSITALNHQEASKLPAIQDYTSDKKSLNFVSNSQMNDSSLRNNYFLDSNGKEIANIQYYSDSSNPANNVATVMYRDTSGNIMYKSKVKDNKLYFYDKNNNPIINSIVDGKITDSTGAWKVGNLVNMMTKPASNQTLNLQMNAEQLDDFYLDVYASSGNTYDLNTGNAINSSSITLMLNNNPSDFDNNIGDIKFPYAWSIYRLENGKWVNLCKDDISTAEIGSLPYRGYNYINLMKSDPTSEYNTIFNKTGTYVVICEGLGVADVFNVECK